jgi:hypothetical protein
MLGSLDTLRMHGLPTQGGTRRAGYGKDDVNKRLGGYEAGYEV